MTPEEATTRLGQQAQAFLNTPAVQAAFADIRRTTADTLFQTSPAATERREELYHFMRALDSFEAQLEQYIQDAVELEALSAPNQD